MPDNNEIFLEFWKNYQWPEIETLYFRLYHDDQGIPICYSRHEQPGKFIEVTPEEFSIARMDVKVIQGQLVYPERPVAPKLRVSDHGVRCHAQDVTVVVDERCDDFKFWNMK